MIRYRDFGDKEDLISVLREVVFLCACSALQEHGEPTPAQIEAILISPAKLKFRGVSNAEGWSGVDIMGPFFVAGAEVGTFTAIHQ